jgi:hypothetical protein
VFFFITPDGSFDVISVAEDDSHYLIAYVWYEVVGYRAEVSVLAERLRLLRRYRSSQSLFIVPFDILRLRSGQVAQGGCCSLRHPSASLRTGRSGRVLFIVLCLLLIVEKVERVEKVSEFQGFRVAELRKFQGFRVAGLQGFRVAELR